MTVTSSERFWDDCPPPTKLIVPEHEKSLWEECHKVNAIGGLELFGWQDGILEGWLGVDENGKWTASVCGNSIPRQNGKTLGVTTPRMQYGMLKNWDELGGRGEHVIYTAHLQKTATETFEYMAEFFDSCPSLRKRVKKIKTALGREEIVLNNGARVKFLARTRNGGRGQHADLLVFDEALALTPNSQASFLPVISASMRPQTIYTSTPPDGESDSEVFSSIRQKAIDGLTSRTAWAEWSTPDLPKAGTPADELIAIAYETNPSMGVLIDEDTVRGEIEQMEPDSFARERLGWWSPAVKANHPIRADIWENSAIDAIGDAYGARTVLAVKFRADGSMYVLAGCKQDASGAMAFELVEIGTTERGTRDLAAQIAKRSGSVSCVVVDGMSGADALCDNLAELKAPKGYVVRPRAGDVIAAATGLLESLSAGKCSHTKQEALDDSALHAVKRPIGSRGGWGFGSDEGHDSTAIEAAALAVWGCRTTKRNPRRKQRLL